MTHKVTFRREALRDLGDLHRFIATESFERADHYVDRVYDACMSLAQMPLRGPARYDLAPGIRILTFEKRVVIAYRVIGRRVRIVNVFYGGRNYEHLLRKGR